MGSLKVLDVTLRDGGCVNNFNFGQIYISKILSSLEASGVDVIELGYLDDKNGSEVERTQYINEKVIEQYVLKHKVEGKTYVAMMDYGKFDVNNLSQRSDNGIDGIRLAFHKKDVLNIIPLGKEIMKKGYKLYIQPMITLRYTDEELLNLIKLVNVELPNAAGFYIVDSFGEMRPNDMNRVLNIVDHNLLETMTLGFHSHNNLQMSYANACALLQFPTNRNIMIDSSVMGMGKGAGNLNTELLLEHLNLFYGKNYIIQPLLEVIDKVINQLHSEFYWGYAVEYYLSSANHCTPSYASYFYNKHMLPIDQVGELLNTISEDKKISFDRDYAEKLYQEFNKRKSVDDVLIVKELKKELCNKTILLIAPGKSISKAHEIINNFASKKDVVTISLNVLSDIPFNYILTTREDVYLQALENASSIIVPSNISKGGRGDVKVLDYRKWIDSDENTRDSSTVIMMNLLRSCNVKNIILAGFDGFSSNINDNYYDMTLRRPVNELQAKERNNYYKQYFAKLRVSGINIKFITPSLYDC